MDYTRRLEDDLDKIARGEASWEKVVTEGSFFLRAEMGRSAPSHVH